MQELTYFKEFEKISSNCAVQYQKWCGTHRRWVPDGSKFLTA